MVRAKHYIYHFREGYDYVPRMDKTNMTGRNPEILTDLSPRQAQSEYEKRKKFLRKGDTLEIRKTTNRLLGI